MKPLFYFNRLKVNMVFCILLSIVSCSNKPSDTVFELSGNAKLNLKDSRVEGKIKVKDNAKITVESSSKTFTNCQFYITEGTEIQYLDSKLAPPSATETRIRLKLSNEVDIDYIKFLEFKNKWAKKDFKKAKSMLEFLNRVDRIENYRFVEGSL